MTEVNHKLDLGRLERVDGWGMASRSPGYVYRPVNVDGICGVYSAATAAHKTIGLRGAGCSYGDASLNSEGIVLDLTRMNRIIDWDPQLGVITVEPGVTIRQLWQYVIEDGWWPMVVSGTMFVTIGGAASMNIHGKNNWKVGPIGDHILRFTIMTYEGNHLECSRESNSELFHAAIGGFGMFGAFTSITLQLKHVSSGLLDVEAVATKNFDHLFEVFESRLDDSDYLVGWVDCFGSGSGLGRGLVHRANYLHESDDLEPIQSLRVVNQELPDAIMGLLPKSVVWRLMQPATNNPGVRAVNFAKFIAGAKLNDGQWHHQSHAGFAFLLDYVPNWKKAYGPKGLIQYQSFIPVASAKETFKTQLTICQRYGIVPYLGVFKRHRADDFLMSHAVNGYSMALDFSLGNCDRGSLLSLTAELDRTVLDAGGRFYPAKDSTLSASTFQESLGTETVAAFRALKAKHDPANIFQTNLSRRLI